MKCNLLTREFCHSKKQNRYTIFAQCFTLNLTDMAKKKPKKGKGGKMC